jgi:hypothetical protein
VLQACLCRQERAIEMNGEQLFPVGEGKIDQRMDDLDASIADENVDLSIFRHRVCDAFLDLRLIRYIHRDREACPPRD